jgi:hypothetical protein
MRNRFTLRAVTHLLIFEGSNHARIDRHAANPVV